MGQGDIGPRGPRGPDGQEGPQGSTGTLKISDEIQRNKVVDALADRPAFRNIVKNNLKTYVPFHQFVADSLVDIRQDTGVNNRRKEFLDYISVSLIEKKNPPVYLDFLTNLLRYYWDDLPRPKDQDPRNLAIKSPDSIRIATVSAGNFLMCDGKPMGTNGVGYDQCTNEVFVPGTNDEIAEKHIDLNGFALSHRMGQIGNLNVGNHLRLVDGNKLKIGNKWEIYNNNNDIVFKSTVANSQEIRYTSSGALRLPKDAKVKLGNWNMFVDGQDNPKFNISDGTSNILNIQSDASKPSILTLNKNSDVLNLNVTTHATCGTLDYTSSQPFMSDNIIIPNGKWLTFGTDTSDRNTVYMTSSDSSNNVNLNIQQAKNGRNTGNIAIYNDQITLNDIYFDKGNRNWGIKPDSKTFNVRYYDNMSEYNENDVRRNRFTITHDGDGVDYNIANNWATDDATTAQVRSVLKPYWSVLYGDKPTTT